MFSCSSVTCWKFKTKRNCLFSIVLPLLFFFFIKHQLTVFKWVCVWAFYSISFMYMSIPLPVPHCFGYCNFMVSLEVTYISLPTLFNIVLAILGLLPLHKHFRINWSIYRKITCGDFVWGSIMSLLIKLGRVNILAILSLPVHERGTSLHV